MGKWWGEFLTPNREQKDPETSSTISMAYNTTGTSTYTKEPQITEYEPNISEIGTAPMHFLAMDIIEIRDPDSAYKYAFTLIDMLTNYMFVIPVKDICRKTLVHEYIYKVSLPFRRMEKFLSDNGTSFINEHWKNLAKALAFTDIQSSPRNPKVNSRIENVHNFLKRTMEKNKTQ